MSQRQTWQLYGLAALTLLILQLGLFAVVWTLNGPYHDQWNYLHVAQRMLPQNEWFYAINNRQFALLNLGIAYIVLPGRPQLPFYLHVLGLYAISLGLFHLFRRFLPRYGGFGLLVSAVYLAYIPNDGTYQTYWLLTYSWPLLLLVVSVILLIEYQFRRGLKAWFLLGAGTVIGYVAARAHESSLPLLLAAPLVWLYFDRRLIWRRLAPAVLWWAVIGIAAAQFVIPYVRGDETAAYQTSRRAVGFYPAEIIENTLHYNRDIFPSARLFEQTRYDYLMPSCLLLVVIGASGLLFWRHFPTQCALPPPHSLIWIALVGLVLVNLGGVMFIYAGLEKSRRHFFAMPGAALLLTSLAVLLAFGVWRYLQLKPIYTLGVLMAVLITSSAQWFYQWHLNWSNETTYQVPFDQRAEFNRQMVSLMPDVADHSLILLKGCQQEDRLPVWMVLGVYDAGFYYLYGLAEGRTIRTAFLEDAFFDRGGLQIPASSSYFPLSAEYFTYAEMVVFECTLQGLTLLDYFPEEYTYPNTNYRDYDPYSRIQGAFIPPEAERVLAK